MNQVITIVTHPTNIKFFEPLIKSFKDYNDYDLYVVVNGTPKYMTTDVYDYYDALKEELNFKLHYTGYHGYELGAIKYMAGLEDVEEFVLLQDTIEIKDFSLFSEMFNHYQNKSVSVCFNFMSYMGKYRNEILRKIDIPIINTKQESVKFEGEFIHMYKNASKNKDISPFYSYLTDTNVFETKHDCNCMILENSYIKKYKRVWAQHMIKEDE